MNDYFLIAEISAIDNTKGYVRILSYSDFKERFLKTERVFIDVFGGFREFFIEDVILQENIIKIKFKSFDTQKDCEFLVGKKIYVSADKAVTLEEDTYFIHDLVGSKVYKEDKFFGVLKDVLILPAQDVYVIEDLNGKECMLPAVKSNIKSFDSNKKILNLTPDSLIYYDEN